MYILISKSIQEYIYIYIYTFLYQNQFSKAYKTDERILKTIVMNNIECTKLTDKLNLIIYYPRYTINNLDSRNNNSRKLPTLKQTNIIYEYSCCIGDCELQKCLSIGMTTTTISRRLTMHIASGGPKSDTTKIHKTAQTWEQLVYNTKIIHRQQDFNRLLIIEALTIQQQRPSINI